MRIKYLSIALTTSILTLTATTQLLSIAQPIQPQQSFIAREDKRTISQSGSSANDRKEKAQFYHQRAIKRYRENNKKGAIADLTRFIKFDPQFNEVYINRGLIKSELGDKKGAIADYDNAIRIEPQSANAYTIRGGTKYQLGDKKGAIADLNIAAQLFKTQKNIAMYKEVMNMIQQISST